MRMLFKNHLENTFVSLRSDRLRSFLTIFGISVGCFLLTSILAITDSAQRILKSQISNAYHENCLLVRPANTVDPSPNDGLASTQVYLPPNDLTALQKSEQFANVVPLLTLVEKVKIHTEEFNNIKIIGSTADLESTMKFKLTDGQFLNDQIIENAAIVGKDLAKQWYGLGNSIGKTFVVRGKSFTVVGVIENDFSSSEVQGGLDFGQLLIVNLSAIQAVASSYDLTQINLKLADGKSVEEGLAYLQNTKNWHLGGQAPQVVNPAEPTQIVAKQDQTIFQILIVVALLALLIGAIGIMNIMFVNVSERTHEIGVRLALGASSLNIVGQFIVEAIILSLIGGLFGVLLALAGSQIYNQFTDFRVLISLELVGLMAAVSLLVGVVAGLLPSVKAANKNPIDSLKRR